MAKEYLRFADLRAQGLVANWPQLKRMIDQRDFPAGFLLTPQTRVFPREEVQAWIDARREAGREAAGRVSERHRALGMKGGRAASEARRRRAAAQANA